MWRKIGSGLGETRGHRVGGAMCPWGGGGQVGTSIVFDFWTVLGNQTSGAAQVLELLVIVFALGRNAD